ncbi:MAG: acyloxyacyl hydrolase [Bacteroidota bacterium]|nr:acyloxyacyl hydrolase [Bacteroidota bacterium]
MLKRFLIFILFTYCVQLTAQPDNTDAYYLKVQGHFGFIMQHRNTMGHLVNGHIGGAEFNFSKPTKGTKLWHYENNFPEQGICVNYTYLSNKEQLGDIIAIAPFYDVPLSDKDKPSRLYMRVSSGLGIATKKFDPLENHKNNVVSATINAYINFKWLYKFNLGERLRLETGLSFSHISNGKYKAPNLGVNMLTFNSGLTYKIKEKKHKEIIGIDSSTKAKSKHELYAIAAYGVNETEPPGGPKFLAQSYTFGYYFNKRNTHKFGGGFDAFYCQSVMQDIFDDDSVRYANKAKYIQIGMRASYSYCIGRLAFPVEFGYYLHTNFTGDGMFYHRIGARYYTPNNIILTFSLKTHWAVAHYFEFGAGYRLPVKKKAKKIIN